MPRWKSNGNGGSYFDPNDDGPDQVAPPTSAMPAAQTTPSPMTGGVTGQPNVGAGDLQQTLPTMDPGMAMGRSSGPYMAGPQGPMIMQPSEGGMWSADGGKASTVDDALAMLKAKFGMGAAGAAMAQPNAASQIRQAVTQRPAVPQTPSASRGIGRTILGALGWRG